MSVRSRLLKSTQGFAREDEKPCITDKGLNALKRAKYLGRLEVLNISG